MTQLISDQLPGDSNGWASRSEFWHKIASSMSGKGKARAVEATPLVLCGHGVSMRVEDGALVVRNGFTHYPQTQEAHRLFRGDRQNPTRIILLDGSGTLSFDVLDWLGEQGIALARVKWGGEVRVIANARGFAGDQTRIEWQRKTRANNVERLAFSTDLIIRKLSGCIETLEKFAPSCRRRDTALSFHQLAIERLSTGQITAVNDVRGAEGQCASNYFLSWRGIQLRWTGNKAVPPNWQEYRVRSSLAKKGLNPYNRNASHPINAMLNYAYAVQLAHIQTTAIIDGYDPTIGIFHEGYRGNAAFALDMIEPERPKVDAAILQFVADNAFSVSDFILTRDGICRLSPQLARTISALASS